MSHRTNAIALLALCGLASPTLAQETTCSTVLTPDQASILLDLQNSGIYGGSTDDTSPLCVPVSVHVLRTSAGTGGVSVADVEAGIARLNTPYAGSNIQFTLLYPVWFIDSDFWYSNTGTPLDVFAVNPIPGTINIYVNNVGNDYGTFTAFPVGDYSKQGVLIYQPDLLSSSGFVLAHEVSHYLNVYHTHETQFGAECPAEGNCADAGDLLCDTAADPTLLPGNTNPYPNCHYIGNATIPGSCPLPQPPYDPPIHNIMSYTSYACRTELTAGQWGRARATIHLRETALMGNANYTTTPGWINRSLCGLQCWANCDGSTASPILNANDFSCFMNAFAAAAGLSNDDQIINYANCDGSTIPPVLNISDFSCYLNRYASGCP